MNVELILKKIKGLKSDKNFFYLQKVGSTNKFAINLAVKGYPEWTIVLADEQTAGKGRMDRTWESKANKGLYFSIIFKPDILLIKIQLLTLFLGIVIVEYFDAYFRKRHFGKKMEFRVKWPNDIYLNGKKMGGILLQTSVQNNIFSYIVAGIGLNINQEENDFSPDILKRATSLHIESEKEFFREDIFAGLINRLQREYVNYEKHFGSIIPRWKSKALYLGKEIKVHQNDKLLRGKFLDINEFGHLIMENYEGNIEIISGDIFGRKEKI